MNRSRRGFTIVEAMATLAVLGATLMAVAQVSRMLGQQQRHMDEAQADLLQAGNLLERLVALPWDELTAETAQRLADEATETRLAVTIEEAADGPPAKRIVVRTGAESSPAPRRPVQLTTWVYRDAAAATKGTR